MLYHMWPLYSFLWSHHIQLVHSSVGGHLGCYYLSALANSAAVDSCVSFSWSLLSILLGLYLGVELLGHMVSLYLAFEELPVCFPQQPLNCTFPLAVCRGSQGSSFLIVTTGYQFFTIPPFSSLVSIWVVSSLEQLWIKLFWAYLYMSLGDYPLFSPSECLGVERLSHGLSHVGSVLPTLRFQPFCFVYNFFFEI